MWISASAKLASRDEAQIQERAEGLVELIQELTKCLAFQFASDGLSDEERQPAAAGALASRACELVWHADREFLSGLSHGEILLE